ncbi:MAG: hypothetical protein RIG84_05120 [Roseovarius sp.]
MHNQWVLDVMADLQVFARRNGLDELAAQLELCRAVGVAEIASICEGHPGNEHRAAEPTGDDPALAGERH